MTSVENSGPTGRVTMQQVAAEAGVSVSTVSKVINERYGVAPETFEHVTGVINRLGYEKFGAQAVGTGRYGAMRSLQIRRFRLPRPTVKRGEYPV